MKIFLLLVCLFYYQFSPAQTIDSMYVNLYTDSLKRGTFNYINVDGQLSNGRFLPLDSSQVIFSSSAGKFSGNSLWVAPDLTDKKIRIKVELRKNRSKYHEFDMYIKQLPDGPLKTVEEVIGNRKMPTRRNKPPQNAEINRAN